MVAYARKSYLFLQQKKRTMVASAFGEDGTGDRQTRLTVDDLKYLFMMWLDVHIYRYNLHFLDWWFFDLGTGVILGVFPVTAEETETERNRNRNRTFSNKGLEVVTRLHLTFDIQIIWNVYMVLEWDVSFFDLEILV